MGYPYYSEVGSRYLFIDIQVSEKNDAFLIDHITEKVWFPAGKNIQLAEASKISTTDN